MSYTCNHDHGKYIVFMAKTIELGYKNSRPTSFIYLDVTLI